MRIPTRAMYFFYGALALAVCASGCAGDASRTAATFNDGAALVGELPASPLAWRVISCAVDPSNGTMSTLYGNDIAIGYARTHAQHDYPAGSVVSLVSWAQKEDPRWYGAQIPSQVKSVEFVTVSAGEKGDSQYSYEAYVGNPLKKTTAQPYGTPPERIVYLFSNRAAVMP
jgi:Cytochrome P460